MENLRYFLIFPVIALSIISCSNGKIPKNYVANDIKGVWKVTAVQKTVEVTPAEAQKAIYDYMGEPSLDPGDTNMYYFNGKDLAIQGYDDTYGALSSVKTFRNDYKIVNNELHMESAPFIPRNYGVIKSLTRNQMQIYSDDTDFYSNVKYLENILWRYNITSVKAEDVKVTKVTVTTTYTKKGKKPSFEIEGDDAN